MKNIFKYGIIVIILLLGLFVLMSFYNKSSNIEIGQDLITKFIEGSFTEKEQKLEGVQKFYNDLNIFDSYYISIDKCDLVSVDESILNQIGSDTPIYEDGIDSESLILSQLKIKFIDKFEENKYNSNVKYKYDENHNLYIHLNSFDIVNGSYQININGFIFNVSLNSVPLTYQNYVNDILSNRNVFEISDIVSQKDSILYTFSDKINGYDIIIRYDKNFLDYAKDIKISMPFKTTKIGICKIFEN